jgi:predicted metal-dependent hydrolase
MVTPSKIIRSRRKSITLQITPHGELLVLAPTLVPKFFIDRFIAEKEQWIQKKLSEVNHRPKVLLKQYAEGEEFLFLGKKVTLQFTAGVKIFVKDSSLFFPRALGFRLKKELEQWYIQQAKELITNRLEYHAKQMCASYTSVRFSDTKSKWGTCFHDNSLQFNWRLIMAPLLVIDYVVIHELTHTTEKNHSRDFWSRVRLFTPAYRQHREWLTKNGHLLHI